MTNPRTKGFVSTPNDPGNSKLMLWIRDVALKHTSDECLIWPFGRLQDGYGGLGRDGKALRAHRYICEWANGPPPSPDYEAAHSCGRGHEGCVSQKHLSWQTGSKNSKDSRKHPHRKLNPAQVEEIRARKGIETARVLAARYGVLEGTIRKIFTGRTWNRKTNMVQRAFTPDEIVKIRSAKNVKKRLLAAQYGVSPTVIYNIQARRTWKHIPEIGFQ